jgi:hypothetical protein
MAQPPGTGHLSGPLGQHGQAGLVGHSGRSEPTSRFDCSSWIFGSVSSSTDHASEQEAHAHADGNGGHSCVIDCWASDELDRAGMAARIWLRCVFAVKYATRLKHATSRGNRRGIKQPRHNLSIPYRFFGKSQ